MSTKTVVRDYRCRKCGVIVKGVRSAGGELRATNRPYTDAIVGECVCASCDEANLRAAIRSRGEDTEAEVERLALVLATSEAARERAEKERDAYKRAKAENDERFMTERDAAIARAEAAEAESEAHNAAATQYEKDIKALHAEVERLRTAAERVVEARPKSGGWSSVTTDMLAERIDALRAALGAKEDGDGQG